jgi:hypothetical protein
MCQLRGLAFRHGTSRVGLPVSVSLSDLVELGMAAARRSARTSGYLLPICSHEQLGVHGSRWALVLWEQGGMAGVAGGL